MCLAIVTPPLSWISRPFHQKYISCSSRFSSLFSLSLSFYEFFPKQTQHLLTNYIFPFTSPSVSSFYAHERKFNILFPVTHYPFPPKGSIVIDRAEF